MAKSVEENSDRQKNKIKCSYQKHRMGTSYYSKIDWKIFPVINQPTLLQN